MIMMFGVPQASFFGAVYAANRFFFFLQTFFFVSVCSFPNSSNKIDMYSIRSTIEYLVKHCVII